MVQSGAKGSMVNTMQISCLLGQIELEGRIYYFLVAVGISLGDMMELSSSFDDIKVAAS